MNVTAHRDNQPAELVVRFRDGEERPATRNDLVTALARRGYMVVNFCPGNHTEVYTPEWLRESNSMRGRESERDD